MEKQAELEKIEDEAATWAVMLADDPDNNEQLRQFGVWLNTSALHAEVWARTRRAYVGLGEILPATQGQWPASASGECREGQIEKNRDVKRGRLFEHLPERPSNWWYPLSGLAIAACLILVFLPHLTLRMSADYVSSTGERQTHLLEDGSTLILAPESAVGLAYSAGKRHVRLLKGTAFFEVQRDPGRPFIVQAGNTRTTVLGTAFSVDMNDSGTTVSVVHGYVRVEDRSLSPAVSENLVAGDSLAISWDEGMRLRHASPDGIARWRKGELVVRDLPVSAVVDAFRRYYGGVILATEPFASQRVTGLYRLDDPVSTLAGLAQAHGATAHQISPWLLVLNQ